MNSAQLIEQFEGRRAQVYDDATGLPVAKGSTLEGNPTIGTGFLISTPGGLSDAEIDWIMANRLQTLQANLLAALPWYTGMSATRQAVLECMAWQIGLEGLLEFHATLNACQQAKYDVAGAAMLNSLWAEQTPSRAQALAKMMIEG